MSITERDYAEMLRRQSRGVRVNIPGDPKPNKFSNIKTEVDGIIFHSKREATRYRDLKLMQQHGLIAGLVLQPRYPLLVNGEKVATYIGDFEYIEQGQKIVEDVKAPHLRKHMYYRLKKKLMRALYGIEIRET